MPNNQNHFPYIISHFPFVIFPHLPSPTGRRVGKEGVAVGPDIHPLSPTLSHGEREFSAKPDAKTKNLTTQTTDLS